MFIDLFDLIPLEVVSFIFFPNFLFHRRPLEPQTKTSLISPPQFIHRFRIKLPPVKQMPEFLSEQVSSASESEFVSVAGISNSCKMDLVPAPKGEASVKTTVVEVEAVDMGEQYDIEDDAPDLALEISSDLESDSDDSDGWDNLSNCDEAIQFLRDDQIRDGLGM